MAPDDNALQAEYPPGLPENPEDTFHSGDMIEVGVVRRTPSVSAGWESNSHGAGHEPRPINHIEKIADNPPPLPPANADKMAYNMLRPFAKGGSGEIWEAVQTALGRTVAVKRMRRREVEKDSSSSESRRQSISFRQEALTTASLEHPNIVPIYDLGLDEEGAPLLAMKMIRGHHWDKMIEFDFDRMLPQDFLGRHLPVLLSVCQAVAFAHSRGIAHRDIKSSQVMVGEFGEVLLTDWGLAVVFDQELLKHSPGGSMAALYTPAVEVAVNPAGTPACMAPEQTASDALQIGAWTDIYLLGGILYQLLTGTMPHEASSSKEAFRRAMLGEVEPPSRRVGSNREVPPQLEDLALHCLEREPKRRMGSVRDFIVAIQEYISGASKRRESHELTERVIRDIATLEEDYKSFQECSELLMRAGTLWADNPQVLPLREYISSAYARAAMKHNDLMLAEMQARSVPNTHGREELLAEIGEHRARLKRHASERRQLVVAFLVLLVVMGWGLYMMRALTTTSLEDADRRRLDQEQAAAAQSRAIVQRQAADALRQLTSLAMRQREIESGLRRELPLPHRLDSNVVAGRTVVPDINRVSGLLQKADVLKAEEARLRLELAEGDRELAPESLPFLSLAGPLSSLYRATAPNHLRQTMTRVDAARGAHPNDPEVVIVHAVVLHRLGQFDKAREQLDRAVRLATTARGPFHPLTLLAEDLAAQAKTTDTPNPPEQ